MYYYFASSLPTLAFASSPPLTEEGFAELCEQHLSAGDYGAFEALRGGGESKHPFVRAWRDFETQYRNAVARVRATKLGAEPGKWMRVHGGWSVALENAVSAAFADSDPLRRDTALAKILWDGAEELAGFDQFSAATIFARFIRLRILIQRAKTDSDAGMTRLTQLSTQ